MFGAPITLGGASAQRALDAIDLSRVLVLLASPDRRDAGVHGRRMVGLGTVDGHDVG